MRDAAGQDHAGRRCRMDAGDLEFLLECPADVLRVAEVVGDLERAQEPAIRIEPVRTGEITDADARRAERPYRHVVVAAHRVARRNHAFAACQRRRGKPDEKGKAHFLEFLPGRMRPDLNISSPALFTPL